MVRKTLTALLLLAVLGVLLSLGTWQVKRLAWKQSLLAEVEARRHASPISISDAALLQAEDTQDASAISAIEYRPAQATGTYLHKATQFFFATWEGQTGYYAYTPMKLADGAWLFVNRGFIPYDAKPLGNDWAQQPQGVVTVKGLLRDRLGEKPGRFVPDNDPAGNIYYWKDLDAMAAQAGLAGERVLPFFLDADATPNPGGWPIGGVTQIAFPNNHLQYAITWYGLAAALIIIVGVYRWRARR